MKKHLALLVTSMWVLFGICAAQAEDRIKSVDFYQDVRGSIVYKTYCTLCHGVKADGTGRAASNYTPRPANLTASLVSDAYKEAIIRKGGAAMGRSEFMPPWGLELSDEQIKDVVFYLGVINVNNLPKKVDEKKQVVE